MGLDRALKRLSLEPSSVCRQCRRTLTSSSRIRQQQQGATSSLAALMQENRSQSQSQTAARIPPRPASDPSYSSASTPASTPSTDNRYGVIEGLARGIGESNRRKKEEENLANLERNATRRDYESMQTRRWNTGDVYAPHDLSGVEAAKWKKPKQKGRTAWDALDQLNLKPMDHYKNFSIMSEYVTEFGRIKHNRETGLRPRNQRKMAKAVRRAIGLGLIPSVYRHPELLEEEMIRRGPRS